MNLRRTLIHTYLYLPYLLHKITKTGSFGHRRAKIITEPVETGANALKSALLKHHVKQFQEAACSVASVVSAINAILAVQRERFEPIHQQGILEKVRTAFWKERMSAGGHNGKRGLPLTLLGTIVKDSLKVYGISYRVVDTVQALGNTGQGEALKKKLWQRLHDFESLGCSLVIAHFDQGAFVPVLNIPHISPVGAFDVHTGEVTVLDVDPEQKNPYKISFDTFCKGLFSNYSHVLRPFGYRSGGYVWIQI